MKKLEHLREKAVELRKRGLSLDDIAERLNRSRTTVYYWLTKAEGYSAKETDKKKLSISLQKAAQANRNKYEKLRNNAYSEGIAEWKEDNKLLRDFAIIYLTEGHRKTEWSPSVANSNSNIIKFTQKVFQKYSKKKIDYRIQYHCDQDLEKIKKFWGDELDIDPTIIKFHRKSNSGGLKGRKWASVNGVLSITIHDTYMRQKIQAWMDLVQEEWRIDTTTK